jgi:peroxidase
MCISSLLFLLQGFPDSILDCRGCDSAQTVHPECWPIPVPKNDPYFPPLNTSSGRAHCIAFTRSLPGQQRLGPREQVNQNTAFIDASQVYGNDRCDASDLREGIDGRLNTSLPVNGRGKHLLPKTNKNKECKAASGFCFYGGDARVSEQPGLAAMHTIFLREHNRLTSRLKVRVIIIYCQVHPFYIASQSALE